MKTKKVITLCASASFYKQVLEIAQELKKLCFKVKYPLTADIMKRQNDFDVSHYKTWYANKADYKRKTYLMRKHFAKVASANAILMINFEKNGIKGYIGGNGLMEMGLQFYLKKPIYLYNPPPQDHPLTEEILGMNPIIINQDLSRVKWFYVDT